MSDEYRFENYRQDDPRWGGDPYARETIAEAGCGPTADANISCEQPPVVAGWMTKHGYASNGSGTYWGGIPAYLQSRGYAAVQLNFQSLLGVTVSPVFETWKVGIRDGQCGAACMGGPSIWTGGGHYITIAGWRINPETGEEEFLVHDPAHRQDGWHPWRDFAGWVKVLYLGGKRWKPEPAPEPFIRLNSGACTENGVQLYRTPGGMVVGSANQGNRFDVDGQTSGDYTRISIATAGVCWIQTRYVHLDGQTPPAQTDFAFVWEAVGPGMTGRHVVIWQKLMHSMHLYTGETSGYFDERLVDATKRLQALRNLEQDGWAGTDSFTAATGLVHHGKTFVVRRVQKGCTGDSVLFLQRLLQEDGYYRGALDASCGDGTDAAIRMAQAAMHQKVDGDFGPKSWAAYLQI